MSLTRVEVTQEVLLACLTHALSTEAEEVMGLLLGDIKTNDNGDVVSRIWMAYPQIRTDRRKDRVETSPEQMARSSAHADRLSTQTGVRTRVVGWYHSHPHITVLPSHVDLNTQSMYQMLDTGFVGLIFSTFNTDAVTWTHTVQATAFQAEVVTSSSMQNDSPLGAFDGLDTPTRRAMQASTDDLASSGPRLTRREVPLVTVASAPNVERHLADLAAVQRILAMEERHAYDDAIAHASGTGSSSRSSSSPPLPLASQLAALHAAGAYQRSLCELLGMALGPSVRALEASVTSQAVQVQQLKRQRTWLLEEVKKKEAAKRAEQAQALSSGVARLQVGANAFLPDLLGSPSQPQLTTTWTPDVSSTAGPTYTPPPQLSAGPRPARVSVGGSYDPSTPSTTSSSSTMGPQGYGVGAASTGSTPVVSPQQVYVMVPSTRPPATAGQPVPSTEGGSIWERNGALKGGSSLPVGPLDGAGFTGIANMKPEQRERLQGQLHHYEVQVAALHQQQQQRQVQVMQQQLVHAHPQQQPYSQPPPGKTPAQPKGYNSQVAPNGSGMPRGM